MIKTSTGFEIELTADVLDDMRFLDVIAETEENPAAYSRLVSLLLGDKKQDFYDHIIKTYKTGGRVPVEHASREINEIIEGIGGDVKN